MAVTARWDGPQHLLAQPAGQSPILVTDKLAPGPRTRPSERRQSHLWAEDWLMFSELGDEDVTVAWWNPTSGGTSRSSVRFPLDAYPIGAILAEEAC
jgi:hypothetical protein